MTLEVPTNESVSAPSPIKKRLERLQDGTLLLTHNLPIGLRFSLRAKNILGVVKISQLADTREHLPEEEKRYFRDVPDLKTWSTGGVIEVWSPTGNPDEYTVVEYQRLK